MKHCAPCEWLAQQVRVGWRRLLERWPGRSRFSFPSWRRPTLWRSVWPRFKRAPGKVWPSWRSRLPRIADLSPLTRGQGRETFRAKRSGILLRLDSPASAEVDASPQLAIDASPPAVAHDLLRRQRLESDELVAPLIEAASHGAVVNCRIREHRPFAESDADRDHLLALWPAERGARQTRPR